VEALCRQAVIATERRNIPSIKKRNGKNGQGDLVLKCVYLGGEADLIIVALIHEFGGNHIADVSRNGELCNAGRLEELGGASGRIHGEFLRLLYILAHPGCPLVRAVRG
jgi:hypothetical protein